MNQVTVMKDFRSELERMSDQFRAALPSHMPVARFQRVIVTALQNNSDLRKCDRQSLWNSCMRAAQDGLLPDGREGAIVPFGQTAQWIPMIGGLRKKARNSGEISTWDVHAVFTNDEFDFELGDTPFIHHKPTLAKERGELLAVYSICTLKSGEKSRDVMSVHEVERIHQMARAQGGPWSSHYVEMAKKSVARRHSKVLPMSSDLDEFIRRDDSLFEAGEPPPRPKLTDFTDVEPDYAGAHQQGIEARDKLLPVDPPSSVPVELQDAYRAGWQSRDGELADAKEPQ